MWPQARRPRDHRHKLDWKACANVWGERDGGTALGTDMDGERRRTCHESRRIKSTAHETHAHRLRPFAAEEAGRYVARPSTAFTVREMQIKP